jgi:hypothetical protein
MIDAIGGEIRHAQQLVESQNDRVEGCEPISREAL